MYRQFKMPKIWRGRSIWDEEKANKSKATTEQNFRSNKYDNKCIY